MFRRMVLAAAMLPIALLAACSDDSAGEVLAAEIASLREDVAALSEQLTRTVEEVTPEPDPSAGESPQPAPAPVIWRVQAEVSPMNGLLVNLAVETNTPTFVAVTYGSDEVGWFKRQAGAAPSARHDYSLVRLRAETEYQYHVAAEDESGRRARSLVGTFTTGPLPEAIAGLEFETEGDPTFELVLADYHSETDTGFIALDSDGEIVWFLNLGDLLEGSSAGPIIQRNDYSLVAFARAAGLVEFSPGGDIEVLIQSSENGFFHHDRRKAPKNPGAGRRGRTRERRAAHPGRRHRDNGPLSFRARAGGSRSRRDNPPH